MERVYDHRRKIEYERVGTFLMSDRLIVGPRIYIEPNNSIIYREVKRLIEKKDYDTLEKYLGIKIGRDYVEIKKDIMKIITLEWREVQPFQYTTKIGNENITFELFDNYYAFLPNATLIILTDNEQQQVQKVYYHQDNIVFSFDKNYIPQPLDKIVAEGQVYEKIFKPLGIPEDAKIKMEKKFYQKYVSVELNLETDKKHVETQMRLETKDNRVTGIKVTAWPFVEGVYSFTLPIGKEVDLTARSIKEIRKKGIKATKVFGPPREVKINDDWKIHYVHRLRKITYSNGNYRITIKRDGEITFESPSTKKSFKKEEVQHIINTAFETPEVIELI